jgi:aspartyl-tRNA(Asn)/glutamyl-tRNA(Gln) amidotransferase subunit C
MNKKITQDDVRQVAKLSRLRLTEDEVSHFTEQLASVLSHIDTLNELNLDDVEPLTGAIDHSNVTRIDKEQSGLSPEAALSNAPGKAGPYFTVPRVLK